MTDQLERQVGGPGTPSSLLFHLADPLSRALPASGGNRHPPWSSPVRPTPRAPKVRVRRTGAVSPRTPRSSDKAAVWGCQVAGRASRSKAKSGPGANRWALQVQGCPRSTDIGDGGPPGEVELVEG